MPWFKYCSFVPTQKKKIVIISNTDNTVYLYAETGYNYSLPKIEVKKGINFSCPFILTDHMLDLSLVIFNMGLEKFKIVHGDDCHTYISQIAEGNKPTSLQFNCMAKIVTSNLVQEAKDRLPIGLRKMFNDFSVLYKVPSVPHSKSGIVPRSSL
jgi:hypothetical protein